MTTELTISGAGQVPAVCRPDPAPLLPHEFLLSIVRGEPVDGVKPTLADRISAAKAAAPYYAPRLATVAHVGPDGGPIRHSITIRFVRPGEATP